MPNATEEIRECYRHAVECAWQVAAETDPQVRQQLLEFKQRWLLLARRYEFNSANAPRKGPASSQQIDPAILRASSSVSSLAATLH